MEQHGFKLVFCAADGKGLYLSGTPQSVSQLFYTDLQGQTRLFWQGAGDFGLWVLPSPDGRYLAMTGTTTTSDAWLLENF